MTSLVGFLQIYTLVISVIRFQGTVFTRGSSAKASVILLPYFPDQPLMKKNYFCFCSLPQIHSLKPKQEKGK